MSAELDRAREQTARADYNRALDTLQQRIRSGPADLDEVRAILEVATTIRQNVEGRIQRGRAERIIADVQDAVARSLEAEMGDTTIGADDLSAASVVYVSTTFDVPGFEIIAFHGPVFGLVVRSRNVFTNLGASAKALVGGELRGLTRLLMEGREDALRRLRAAARSKGANAVIGLRYDTSEIGDSGNEVVAYGTAVSVQRFEVDRGPSL